jgi:hypothetical protein
MGPPTNPVRFKVDNVDQLVRVLEESAREVIERRGSSYEN